MLTPEIQKALRVDLNEVLKAVGVKHNVSLTLGPGTYNQVGTAGYLKLEVGLIEDGKPVLKEMTTLRLLAQELNLTEAHLTQIFTLGCHQYVLAGFKNTGCRKPFLIKKVGTEEIYVCPKADVKLALGIKDHDTEQLRR
jgi:hypothetical protein